MSVTSQLRDVPSVEVLRVAQAELEVGNTNGNIFVQLSAGAVALQMDRQVAQARISRFLHQAIDEAPIPPPQKEVVEIIRDVEK